MLLFVLAPPDSGSAHTDSLPSIKVPGRACTSDWMDCSSTRGSVGDSEAGVGFTVGLCRSVCVDRAGSTVSTGKCEATGSSGKEEGADSAGFVRGTCAGCDECVGSCGCEEGGDVCVVEG